MSKKDKDHIVTRGVLLPAAAVGSGLFLGSIVGGTSARALLRTPGMKRRIARMSPQERAAFVRRVGMATGSIGGAAGAGVSGISYGMLKRELDKREKRKESEKKASFEAFFAEMSDNK